MTQEILPPLPADPAAMLDDDDLPEELAFTPVARHGKPWTGINAQKQRIFIARLAATGAVSMAAQAIGHSSSALYQLRKRAGADSFAAAWDRAVEMGARRVADLLMEYAIYGVPETLSKEGRVILERRRPNIRAMQHIAASRFPEGFGANLNPVDGPDTAVPHSIRRLRDKWRAEWEAERQARIQENNGNQNRQETDLDDRLRTIRTAYQRRISHDPVKRAAWDMLTGPGTDWDAVRKADAFLHPQKHEWHMHHPDMIIPLAAGAGNIDWEAEEGGDLSHVEWHPPAEDPDGSKGQTDEIWFGHYGDHIVEGAYGESNLLDGTITRGDMRAVAHTVRERAEAWQAARPPVLDRPYGIPKADHMRGGTTLKDRDATRRRVERDIRQLEREYAAAYSDESWAAWKAGEIGGGTPAEGGGA